MFDEQAQLKIEGLVADIARGAGFGPARSIRRLTGGMVNQVFRFDSHVGELVIRLNRACFDVFCKERWAMEQAARVGVNVPLVHAVGEAFGYCYMIMSFIHGVSLSSVAVGREQALVELGRQVRLINSIAVDGYGFLLAIDAAGNGRFPKTWQECFAEEQQMIFADDACVRVGALTARVNSICKRYLAPMEDWHYPARLCHGDVSFNNVQIQDDGRVFILDWTQAKGGVAPFYDLAGLSMTEGPDFESVCLGYGLTEDELCKKRSDFNRIALTDVMRAAGWAYSVSHPQMEKFAADVRRVFRRICSL